MDEDGQTHHRGTRREYLRDGVTTASFGLLAGCTNRAGSEPSTDPADGNSGSYSVSIEPPGEVIFESVPQRWIAYQYAYGDMGVALGQAEGYLGTNKPENYPDFFYDELPGVDFDASTLTNIGSGDREIFYELDPDVLFVDPNNAKARFEWSQSDIDELTRTVAPFFGHFGRRYGYESQENAPRYELYELFEKVAAVFQQRERYRKLKAIHDDVIDTVSSRLPAEDERPTVGLLSGGSNVSEGKLYLMAARAPGYGRKQYRDLEVKDVLETVETDSPFYQTDFEELLSLDPDILVVHWTVQLSDEEFAAQFVEPFEADPVGSELTAVKNDRVVKGGTAEQGPIINLFQTERTAEQLYPDRFGGAELFDREAVAAVVTGSGDTR